MKDKTLPSFEPKKEDSIEKLGKIFHFKGGNAGLTEEFIYNNQPRTDEGQIPILSSATLKTNLMGYISSDAMPKGKKLKIFKDRCILVARNGYAGTMTFIDGKEFTANDHAYVLVPRKEWTDRINLRWFVYEYQELFYSLVTSKSDNATFNKEYAENQKVVIPTKDFQDRLAKKLTKLDQLVEETDNLRKSVEDLMRYQIIA